MKKFFSKIGLVAICIIGLAFSAAAQKPGDQKKPPKSNKKDPPKIVVRPKKDKPKNNKKKPKKPVFGEFLYLRQDD